MNSEITFVKIILWNVITNYCT